MHFLKLKPLCVQECLHFVSELFPLSSEFALALSGLTTFITDVLLVLLCSELVLLHVTCPLAGQSGRIFMVYISKALGQWKCIALFKLLIASSLPLFRWPKQITKSSP